MVTATERYVVETTIDDDPIYRADNPGIARDIEAGILEPVRVYARVVNLKNGRIGHGSLNGILIRDDGSDKSHVARCLSDAIAEARSEAGC